ncbi:MAG TPA: Hsp20/alpha crystallin family protein [Blastocatellia bacterium]|nr:Hsp20/alpha crystallin family protein [Blastocatellia bacterium]
MAKAKEMQQPESQQAQNQTTQNQNQTGGQLQSAAELRGGGLSPRRSAGLSTLMSDPFSMMHRFAEEMDRIFENFGMGRSFFGRGMGQLLPQRGGMMSSVWSPRIELFERDNKFCVRAELPGLNRDDVNVEVTDDALIIQGERRQESEENRQGLYHSERSYGSFYRAIPLPEGVNGDEAQATFRDGVLEVTMPAPRQQQNRRIEIK